MNKNNLFHRVLTPSLCLFLSLVMVSANARAQSARRPLSGHLPPGVSRLKSLGDLAATNRLRLVIGLPSRDPDGLKAMLEQLYDPASPDYHHFLSPAEFTDAFSPTEADYQKVIDFATSHGMTVMSTQPSRLVLEVNAPVANIETAFQVRMRNYQHPSEARAFYSPDVEPSVESGLPIRDIGGLNNYTLPRPRFRRSAPIDTHSTERVGSGPSGLGYMGTDFRTAYASGITNTGAGQSVGLLEFDNYYPNDIRLYETNAHLSTNLTVTNVYLNGFGGTPGDGNGEVALDIELAMAMAPGLSKVLVYAESYPSDATSANLLLAKMANDNAARQLSCSWIIPMNATSDTILQQCAAQGQSFYDASGDDGAYVGDIPAPSDDPYMTQVGGTVLSTSGAGGAWLSETNWFYSSGGVSHLYPIPTWQQSVNLAGTAGSPYQRNFPDVAMVASNIFIVADNASLETVSGTSCGAPLWAGFTALVNQQAAAKGQQPVGLINSAVYRICSQSVYSSNFHDITIGNNATGYGVSEFYTKTGYDLCTGWGTPKGLSLMNALLATPDSLQVTPSACVYMTGPVGGPFNISNAVYSVSNSGLAALNWTNTRTAAWLGISSGAGGALGAHAVASNITVSLNSAASLLAAGVYNVTVWFTNQTTQVAQARQFSLSVGQPYVANGGFETADISNWILTGDNGYDVFANDSTVNNGYYFTNIPPHSGSFSLLMGTTNLTLATLYQTISSFPGQPFTLSFWLENPDAFGGGTTPNEFMVSWNGATLYDQVNMPTLNSYTNFQYHVVSGGLTNLLLFGSYNINTYFSLDDVSLTAAPLPQFTSAKATNGVFTCKWGAITGQKYQVQYSTNPVPNSWVNLGSSFTAASTNITTTDTITTGSHRFYRVIMLW